MRLAVLLVVCLLATCSIGDVITFEIEDMNIGYSEFDRDIDAEVYITNDTDPPTNGSFGYQVMVDITGDAGVTFNGASQTVFHPLLLSSWNPDPVQITNSGQRLTLYHADVTPPPGYPTDHNDGLARLNIHVPGGTTNAFTLSFVNAGAGPGYDSYLHDETWPQPGYIELDSANPGTISMIPEASTLGFLLAGGLVFLARRKRWIH